MKAYRITDWDNKYEVGPEGKPANESTRRYRKSSLPFVRLKILSESNGMAYRKLLRLAGKDAPAVFGFFCMFLEIAANRDRTYRGWLLDEQQRPLSAEDLAFELGCENELIEKTLTILADERLNWLKLSDFQTNFDSTVKLLYNETEENKTEHNETKDRNQQSPTEPEAKATGGVDLEKISRNLRNKPRHQIGNLSPSLNNVLSNMHPVREFRSPTDEAGRSIPPKCEAFSNGARNSSLKNSSSSDSASAEWDWKKAKEQWSLAMQKYFPQSRFIRSDATTFVEMIKHLYEKHGPLTDELFNKAADLAAEAKSKPGVKNPVAYFVSRFKTEFGDFTK